MQAQSPPFSATALRHFAGPRYEVAVPEPRWCWPDVFIALQVLWGLALFLPGAQDYRVYVRALPYVVSAASLLYYFRRPTGEPLHLSTKWLLACFALLLLNLLHPTAHLMAGLGQVAFQISIAAPAFWMARAVCSERRLTTFLWVFFASSFAASVVGILQVYFPETFLPPEFSFLAQTLNPDIISSLTYVGADGRDIIRPPGLSDVPGGAAVAGMMTTILGLTLAMHRDQRVVWRLVCVTGGAVGMTTLFLTQIRSLSLLAAAGVVVCTALRFRQGRASHAAVSAVVGMTVIGGAYLWAVSVGGDAVAERFTGMMNEGVLKTFDESRGLFIRYTISELLYEFPVGAGLGRWGMMQVLFGDPTLWQAPPIHVEIQPTGWLLDGGIPLLLASLGAL
ncbi:MAG TPA: hypothetical protein VFS23_06805, partial [Vicinamibacterales bacterium]|nr:hypothetical protein [Vicinamibacterales bacterium]